MHIRIKICGLKRGEDIVIVNRYQPDYAGFVFAESSRKVSEEDAYRLRQEMDERIQAVGVFVNAPSEQIVRLCRRQTIQMVQLHGEEDAEYIRRLKEALAGIPADIPVIRAVRVRSAEQILEAEQTLCDYLLLDTYQKGIYGGSGRSFDKRMIPKLQKPYFLAGGLTPENVIENVIENVSGCSPWAVDTSSGVETDGWKDEEKIRAFIERVRQYE